MISLLLPTRGRTKELLRMSQSAFATAKGAMELVVYVDEDDDRSIACIGEWSQDYPITAKVAPRIRNITDCWNQLVPLASGDIFCLANDDVIFRTPGWDVQVECAFEEISDKILMVAGNDGSGQPNNDAPHPFVHRKWVDTIGYFLPPYFSSDFGDLWLNDVAKGIGRRKFLPFTIEHMHFTFGKADKDQTTLDRLKRHDQDNPEAIYKNLLSKRELDMDKLRAVMNRDIVFTEPSDRCRACKGRAVVSCGTLRVCNACGIAQ